MELKKNGLLYKVAYGWTSNKPLQTNLCQFFWRVALSLLIVWPLIAVWKVVDYGLIRGVGSVIAFVFFGYRPVSWAEKDPKNMWPFKPISWWPKYNGIIVPYEREPIAPAQVSFNLFVLAVLIGAFCFVAHVVGYVIFYKGVFQWLCCSVLFATGTSTAITLSLVGLIALAVVYFIVKKSEWWKITSEFIKAKKQKVCPLISFVDDPKN